MIERVVKQITAIMNDYNFGVEVEMNHIKRWEAAKVAANFFGTGRFEDTASRNRYYTWSAWDCDGREWKFSRDASIHGPEDERTEMVTPVLEYSDIPLLQELLRKLRSAGAVSNPNEGCGVHIHVSRKGGFSCNEVINLVNIMASHEKLIGRAIRIDERRTFTYCRTVDPQFLQLMHTKRPKTLEDLEEIWYRGNDADYGRTQHYNGSRYHMLNLHSFFNGHGTFEFRLFQFANPYIDEDGKAKKGGIHAGEIKAYIQLCIAMCELAHELKHASSKEPQSDNDKFALTSWLFRLGMVGDEFKTARLLLLKNLTGDCALRYAC